MKISNLSHVEQVRILAKAGAKLIQLREKHASSQEFFEQAKKSVEIARNFGVKIIINDRVDIAFILKADGVHLGQNDLSPEYARQILGNDAIIGISTHNIEQALAAIELPVDYIAIGPVFLTKTKKNAEETVGPEGVSRIKNAIGSVPLVAIGGIDGDNFQTVLKSGADSLAMISELLSPPERIAEKLTQYSR